MNDELQARRERVLNEAETYRKLTEILRVEAFHPGIAFGLQQIDTEAQKLPRWPSSIEGIDSNVLMEGLYGTVALVGAPGAGKSRVALHSALQAAQSGWRVFYILLENADYVMADRITRFMGMPWQQWEKDLAGSLSVLKCDDKTDLRAISAELAMRINEGQDQILIVIDSVNLLAQSLVEIDIARGGTRTASAYFDRLAEISRWSRRCSEKSQGAISMILVSEANQRGEARGQNLEHSASVVIRLAHGKHPGNVSVNVSKSREGGDSDLGEYIRDPETLQLLPPAPAWRGGGEDPFGG